MVFATNNTVPCHWISVSGQLRLFAVEHCSDKSQPLHSTVPTAPVQGDVHMEKYNHHLHRSVVGGILSGSTKLSKLGGSHL